MRTCMYAMYIYTSTRYMHVHVLHTSYMDIPCTLRQVDIMYTLAKPAYMMYACMQPCS